MAATIGLLVWFGEAKGSHGTAAAPRLSVDLVGSWTGTVTGHQSGVAAGEDELRARITGGVAGQQVGTFEYLDVQTGSTLCTGSYTFVGLGRDGTGLLYGQVMSGPCNDGDVALTLLKSGVTEFYAVSPAVSMEDDGVLSRN
ncbi:hypothetical protein KDK95_08750 [Actinospica sp. MGRD01-02]|uniref:Uncharacterized protein n=1 Tax=Actinospica acidithermotolerans TaxID=2828514 RepID=A0A941E9C3_9ACTN|nr:hypothetical protein [Actinospica acidithermotolerans]MBR7826388.1 hypothetical protein [Actinospica acidithermotolerans]